MGELSRRIFECCEKANHVRGIDEMLLDHHTSEESGRLSLDEPAYLTLCFIGREEVQYK